MAFDDEATTPRKATLEEENAGLTAQIESLRRLQNASFERIDKIEAEREALLQREQRRMMKRGAHPAASHTNHADVDVDMSDSSGSGV